MPLSKRQINMYQVSTSVQGDALGPGVEVVEDTGEQYITAQTHHCYRFRKRQALISVWNGDGHSDRK